MIKTPAPLFELGAEEEVVVKINFTLIIHVIKDFSEIIQWLINLFTKLDQGLQV